jgi:hypothetical protein
MCAGGCLMTPLGTVPLQKQQSFFKAVISCQIKNCELQSSINSQDVQLLFGLFLHLTKW